MNDNLRIFLGENLCKSLRCACQESFGYSVSEEKLCQKSHNQKQKLPMVGVTEQFSQRMLPTKFRFIWPSGFTEYYFSRNRSIGNKNGLWRLCLLTDWDEICNLIEDLLYMLPTKFGFIWGSGFRREDFLEIYQSEKRIASGGHVCKRQHAHRFFHLGVHVPFYLLLWVYIHIFGGAMYPLTLHLILGVQRK